MQCFASAATSCVAMTVLPAASHDAAVQIVRKMRDDDEGGEGWILDSCASQTADVLNGGELI